MSREELNLYRFLSDLQSQLERVRDAGKAMKIALRSTQEFFEAASGCVVRLRAGASCAEVVTANPRDAAWDMELMTKFLKGDRPRLPRNVLVAPLVRRGRTWAAIGLERREDYDVDDVHAIARVARTVSKLVQEIDRLRMADVRSRIERKMLEQLRPKDLFYQILHGLRSLTRYDHSAAVLIHEQDAASLEVVAEQIAWRKGKSRSVGERIRVAPELRRAMEAGGVHGFDRKDGEWVEWRQGRAAPLAEALDYGPQRDSGLRQGDEQAEMSLLCAPLATNDGALGVLKVASCHAGALGTFEADAIARFVPHVSIAVRNLMRNRTLELGVLEAERKHVMADLARGVSHDVNNALGSVLPLVQQMRVEFKNEQVDPAVVMMDLEQIEHSLKACQRIFGGMLNFARASSRDVGSGNVRTALDSTLAILADSLRRHGVRVDASIPEQLPLVRGSQGDLEQLVLNLATNARDAMPTGGKLEVTVVHDAEWVTITVTDDGVGIDAETRARILEPFFTTKPQGKGLGLAICRSIVWNLGGKLAVESEPGEGTRVLLRLPLAGTTAQGAAS